MFDTNAPWENELTTDWRITLLGSEEIARATRAFHFVKPAGLEFVAGIPQAPSLSIAIRARPACSSPEALASLPF